MNLKILVPVCWILWSALALFLLYGLGRVLTERTNSPEAGRGLGVAVIGLVLLILLGLGVWLYLAARQQSVAGVTSVALLLAFPAVGLVVIPAVTNYKKWSFDREGQKVGDFHDASLRPFAEAIDTDDATTLRTLLDGKSPPESRDRAGHDLLAYAVRRVAEGKAGIEVLRILLEAGADPKSSHLPDGQPLLHTLVLGRYWAKDAAPAGIALLLTHGADPDEKDPTTGDVPLRSAGDQPDVVRLLVEHGADIDQLDSFGLSPVVNFTSTRRWDSAIYLVEHGARLDVTSPSGVSLDYYLKDWRDSVFGEHPEGWDRLRTAIAARRNGQP